MSEASGPPKVLIIEDDRPLAVLIQKHLVRAGMETRVASSGGEALDLLNDHRFDLLLLDVGLPDMSGLNLIMTLAQRGRQTPFLVVTGRGDQQTAVEMMKQGARDFLFKDASLLDLLPAVVTHTCKQLERDRRLAEAEAWIARQNQFLENIINALPHPLYVLDADTCEVQLANENARRMHRPPFVAEAASPPTGDSTGDSGTDSPIDEVKRTGKPMVFEHIEYGDGELVAINEIHVCPLLDDKGNIRQVIEYDIDVTHRRRAEQALRESEARLRQVLESLPIVLTSHDAQGQPKLIVGAVEELLGRSAEQLMREPRAIRSMVHPDDAAMVDAAVETAFAEHHAFELEFRIRHATHGRDVWLHAQVVPVWDEEGTLVRADSILIDKTQERKAAAEREQWESRSRQSQKLESIGVLAGGIAHDFNNLLTIISGNAQFLRESLELGKAESKALADIEAAAANASDMTRALQAFSRPSKPEISIVDANAVVGDVYRFLRRLIPTRIEFELTTSDAPCTIAADPGQVQQILVNLCVNARDAVGGQGRIEIRTGRIGPGKLPPRLGMSDEHRSYIDMAVIDNGCGMAPETLRQAFDPFFTTKEKDQGTGLGLAIVYGIVQAHNGIIDVQSEPGRGTEVHIYLPEARPAESAPAEDDRTARGTERILVVDDEEMVASLIRTLLERSGYRVTVTHQADEALNLARSAAEPAELVIIDYALHGSTGDDCLRQLREIWPGLKAILITGYPAEVIDAELQDVRLLTKPFSSQAITTAVREALDE